METDKVKLENFKRILITKFFDKKTKFLFVNVFWTPDRSITERKKHNVFVIPENSEKGDMGDHFFFKVKSSNKAR